MEETNLSPVCSNQQVTRIFERWTPDIKNASTRCTLYLAVVPASLGYATQVWSPQLINLIKWTKCIQCCATKFILNLPYMCSATYNERFILSNFVPLPYWHEYLDILFFFKSIKRHVLISENTLPTHLEPSRPTRSTHDPKPYKLAVHKKLSDCKINWN